MNVTLLIMGIVGILASLLGILGSQCNKATFFHTTSLFISICLLVLAIAF